MYVNVLMMSSGGETPDDVIAEFPLSTNEIDAVISSGVSHLTKVFITKFV